MVQTLSLSAQTFTCTFTGTDGQTLYARVKAVDGEGNGSAWSDYAAEVVVDATALDWLPLDPVPLNATGIPASPASAPPAAATGGRFAGGFTCTDRASVGA